MSLSIPLAPFPSGIHESSLARQQELESAVKLGRVLLFLEMIGAMTPISKNAMFLDKSHYRKFFQNRDFNSKLLVELF